MSVKHDEQGRRLYKARGPDGEVAWVDHDGLWRLQQDQAEQLRRAHARRRRRLLVALAALVALALVLVLLRLGLPGPSPAGPVVAERPAPPPATGEVAGRPAAEREAAQPVGEEEETAPPAGTQAAAARAAAAKADSPAAGDAGGPARQAPATEAPGAAPAEGVAAAVGAWAAAWEGQDVAAYLASYGDGFRPAYGWSRARWESWRRERLLAPASIRLEIEELEITLGEDGRAEARFLQRYTSPDYADVVRKTLRLAEVGGEWRIVTERATAP